MSDYEPKNTLMYFATLICLVELDFRSRTRCDMLWKMNQH